VVFDSMLREGAGHNARWLVERHRDRIEVVRGDVGSYAKLQRVVAGAEAIFHLAAQVAVTTSMIAPEEDFRTNAAGTLNVLECVRRCNPDAAVLFASTNKGYGRLVSDDEVARSGQRYVPLAPSLSAGVSETTALDLHSPYGCSKGAADQYVHDYARVFGLRTVVMRMSCIYGPRQFGTEDQGWVAHFLIRAIQGAPITIYGDGYQVRDVLFIEDAVDAWLRALDRIDDTKGCIFNLGGGQGNSISLREMLALIGEIRGAVPDVRFAPWRPGDQPWYVSDVRSISGAVGWSPRTSARAGVRALERWLAAQYDQPSRVPVQAEARA